jgi:hypothetical protein
LKYLASQLACFAHLFFGERRRNQDPRIVIDVLRLVVVELSRRNHLTRYRHFRIVVSQHGYLDFARVDTAFDDIFRSYCAAVARAEGSSPML